MNATFLTAEWRKLAIVNYSVDPSILLPYLPYGTELDIWNGKCYVSLVAFRFINTKLKGIPVPFHKHFEEINLRFYVRYKEGITWKRGVTFIKEIVPKPALAFVANTIYKEKYTWLPTDHDISYQDESQTVWYGWKHKSDWDSVSVTAEKASKEIAEGSEEEFITEHYWGYTRLDKNRTSEYQVEHPRWKMYPVISHQLAVRFGELYGPEFHELKHQAPDSVMLAEGSKIVVRVAGKIKRTT